MSAVAKRRQTRAELVEEYRALVRRGWTPLRIAEHYGKSYSAVGNLLADPDGSKQRARRRRYQGTCSECGAPTDGSNGRGKAPSLYREHSAEAQRSAYLFWTRDRIIASIHEWVDEHGRRPVAADWLRAVEGSPGQYIRNPRSEWVGKRRWPSVSCIQREFGSWANALEAAGLGYMQSGDRLRPAEWRRHGQEAQRRRWGFARDYGTLVSFGAQVGSEQLEAVKKLDPELPLSEHMRRALDVYLAVAVQPTAEEVGQPSKETEQSDLPR